jgi:hypothetical protein
MKESMKISQSPAIRAEWTPKECSSKLVRFPCVLFFSCELKDLVAGTQSLNEFDWDWKKDRVTAPMDKGELICCRLISILTFLATHIIFSGEMDMQVVDSAPLGSMPHSEIEPVVATLTAHKHLFEATAPLDDEVREPTLLPGCHDFCCLFRVKVPVRLSYFPHQPLY